MPVGRMYAYVARDERRLKELLAFLIAVFIAGELLAHTRHSSHLLV